MKMAQLRAASETKIARRRRRPAATTTTSHRAELPLPLLLLHRLVGVMAHEVTSGCGNPPAAMRVVCGFWCTTLGAIAQRIAGISKSFWSNSVSSRRSSHTATACLPTYGKASSKLPPRATRRRRWSSKKPRGHSRPSTATPTPTPAMMSIVSSSTSRTMASRTSRPGAWSRRSTGQWEQLHQH
jgi:hypothetical protein